MKMKSISKEDILFTLKGELPILKREYGVNQIAIYGSFSKDEASPDSDIDILVRLSRPLGLDFVNLAYHLEAILQRKVDLVTFDSLERNLKKGRRKRIADDILRTLIYV